MIEPIARLSDDGWLTLRTKVEQAITAAMSADELKDARAMLDILIEMQVRRHGP